MAAGWSNPALGIKRGPWSISKTLKILCDAAGLRVRIAATGGAFFNQSSHSRALKILINEDIKTIPHDAGNRNMGNAVIT